MALKLLLYFQLALGTVLQKINFDFIILIDWCFIIVSLVQFLIACQHKLPKSVDPHLVVMCIMDIFTSSFLIGLPASSAKRGRCSKGNITRYFAQTKTFANENGPTFASYADTFSSETKKQAEFFVRVFKMTFLFSKMYLGWVYE